MNKRTETFLKLGLYNNTIYFPTTYKKVKEYLINIKPMINRIKNIDEDELYDYINKEKLNIYTLSICVGILELDEETSEIINRNINNSKELYIFLWIYTLLNGKKNNSFLNKLLIRNMNLIKDNLGELYKVYKPSRKYRIKINSYFREKYKLRYRLEIQEDVENLLITIKELKIKPRDLYVEMGFTFDLKIKNKIVLYFLKNFDIIEIIYFIDRWYVDDIPSSILIKLKEKINALDNYTSLYKLFVLNTSLDHENLSDLIDDKIEELLNKKQKRNQININYIPYMNSFVKWDGLHTYNSYVASITCLFNSMYNLNVNIKDRNIDSSNNLDLYEEILSNSCFSLNECEKVKKIDIPTILFSNKIIEGYNILWDITNEKSPMFKDLGYLNIIGKNEYLIDVVLKIINGFAVL